MEATGFGLNIFQIIQNELITREGNRSTVGLGFRLAIIEERLKNQEARTKNNLVWRPHHTIMPISCPTPRARRLVEAQRQILLERKGANPNKDDKNPTMHMRDEEFWEIHHNFPKTVLEFKQLQFQPDRIRSLLEFYAIKVYRPDMKVVNLDSSDHLVDIRNNLEACLEELAMNWGLNYFRMGGLVMPGHGHGVPVAAP